MDDGCVLPLEAGRLQVVAGGSRTPREPAGVFRNHSVWCRHLLDRYPLAGVSIPDTALPMGLPVAERPEWLFCVRCGTRLVPPAAPAGELKPVCPACGWFRPTYAMPVALVLAHTVDRRVLLARRRNWPQGAWALVAGFIEAGETAEAAALRELAEEAGLLGRDPRVQRTLVRDDLLLVCVEVEIEGEPRAGSDVDEVLLDAANPELIPREWQARELVEDYLRGWK